jgi:hypothetical protein
MSTSLPPTTHSCWQQLASGALERLSTQHLGTQLMCKRMERSTDAVELKAAELHAYFTRWERILPSEVAQITRL